MRVIKSDEVYKLKECLTALAAHHNKISINFKGCYPKTPIEDTMDRFADELENETANIAVIENDEKVVGFCKINHDNKVGVLEYLVVLEEHRGMGYGAVLMEWALDEFSKSGVHDIDVKVVDGNEAITMYEKYGFKMNAHLLRLSR